MRKEEEVFQTIILIAENDERVRAVLLNGSRASPNAKKDSFQDFDIVYVVTELDTFKSDHSWVEDFGEILIMQCPDQNPVYMEAHRENKFAYLMQFMDGNRIDLTLHVRKERESLDSLTEVLVDKDGQFNNLPASQESDYFVKKPSLEELNACSNEFWWVSTYVAKGLWRKEMPYARAMLEGPVRQMAKRMLSWSIGVEHDFRVNVGSQAKYLESYLSKERWDDYSYSYRNSNYDEMWSCLFTLCDLFIDVHREVASYLGYPYQSEEPYTHKKRNKNSILFLF
ncbi:aminoglycoside 6-adenylyltransferase [Halobacillus locisalis]|uniref:Aminoglycoside 6-adenylyltransferase n=1 Tax=Halobacillus locisalis TaxID=220753 RepID=A0A838CQS3_9BACI|nr:aminoglycoside 6-adenylyltransferase [Halobacillus locisalis]MBA2173976.1 aminoglycoside 6-adenylyltransferase [Halobacillus locisalis]